VINVRRPSESDGPALARIDLATRGPVVSPAPPPADATDYLFFGDRTKPSDVLVAELDDSVAEWVKVQSASPLMSHRHVREIGGLAVDPAHQGAGVGRRLVAAAVQECGRRSGVRPQFRSAAASGRARSRCGCWGTTSPLAASTTGAASCPRACSGESSCWRAATSTTSSWLATSLLTSHSRSAYGPSVIGGGSSATACRALPSSLITSISSRPRACSRR